MTTPPPDGYAHNHFVISQIMVVNLFISQNSLNFPITIPRHSIFAMFRNSQFPGKLNFLKKTPFVLLSLALSFGLWSCKDPDVPPKPPIPQDTAFIAISSNVRNLLDYDLGSYFVYRDSLTGKRDSQYVIQNDHYTQLGYLQSGELYGKFERIKTIFENEEGVWRTFLSPIIWNTDSLWNLSFSISLANGQGNYYYDYEWLSWEVGRKWGPNGFYSITDYIGSTLIGAEEFKDVYVIQRNGDPLYGGDTILNYYQPQIGLIKQKNPQGTKCVELVNYKILR